MEPSINRLTKDNIRQLLTGVDRNRLESPYPAEFNITEPRQAAVLMPLFYETGMWKLLYIRRTSNHQDPHSGQIAFPGGGMDPGDNSPEATALRETEEEIGIRSSDIEILGSLHTFDTVTGYRVTPVVGLIPWPYLLKIADGEVSRVFSIPLAWLENPNNRSFRIRNLPPPYDPIQVIYYKPYDGEILWGASARFTQSLLEILGE